jgi:CDP-diacylglycerol---serine O-phosphatidyltransferase
MNAPEPARSSRGIPLRALIPNAVTALALCAGLSGVRFALSGDFDKAVLAVVIAGVLDGVDGRLARLLKGTSRFGAELDSLSDVIAFGVAPALILFLWSLSAIPKFGWVFALGYAVCCAMRLARFNANLDVDEQPHKRSGFLTGVPSPSGAGLVMSPIFLYFATDQEWFRSPWVVAPVVAVVALLLVSNLPTYSWKSLRLRRSFRLPALIALCLFFGALFTATWWALSALALTYMAAIPVAVASYRRAFLRRNTPPATLPPPSSAL